MSTKEPTVNMESSPHQDAINDSNNAEYEEEDWSNEMVFHPFEGAGNYATHNDLIHIYLNSVNYDKSSDSQRDCTGTSNLARGPKIMKLFSVQSLSPLDMMALYNGSYDATGNRIWMAAHFFIKLFAFDYGNCIDQNTFDIDQQLDETIKNNSIPSIIAEKLKFISKLRRICFQEKKVLELGCGTGCSGISLLLGTEHKTSSNGTLDETNDSSYRPSFLLFTDSDLGSLDLCRKNCLANNLGCISQSPIYDVCHLEWSESPFYHFETFSNGKDTEHLDDNTPTKPIQQNNPNDSSSRPTSPQPRRSLQSPQSNKLLIAHSFHTIIASDVIYNVDAIKPLFCTASHFVQVNGYFILSHVPRAYMPPDSKNDDFTSTTTVDIDCDGHDDNNFHPNNRNDTHGFPRTEEKSQTKLPFLSPLEHLLIQQAKDVGFHLFIPNNDENPCETDCTIHNGKIPKSTVVNKTIDSGTMNQAIIRPLDIQYLENYFLNHLKSNEDNYTLEEMHDAGSAIFIFQKVS